MYQSWSYTDTYLQVFDNPILCPPAISDGEHKELEDFFYDHDPMACAELILQHAPKLEYLYFHLIRKERTLAPLGKWYMVAKLGQNAHWWL